MMISEQDHVRIVGEVQEKNREKVLNLETRLTDLTHQNLDLKNRLASAEKDRDFWWEADKRAVRLNTSVMARESEARELLKQADGYLDHTHPECSCDYFGTECPYYDHLEINKKIHDYLNPAPSQEPKFDFKPGEIQWVSDPAQDELAMAAEEAIKHLNKEILWCADYKFGPAYCERCEARHDVLTRLRSAAKARMG